MADNSQPEPVKPTEGTPIGAIILLSIVFPGAGQLAIGHKTKGWAIIAISTLLLIAFFIQLAAAVPPIYEAIRSGAEPVIDGQYLEKIHNILLILLAAVIVWFYAVVDAIYHGRRKFAQTSRPERK